MVYFGGYVVYFMLHYLCFVTNIYEAIIQFLHTKLHYKLSRQHPILVYIHSSVVVQYILFSTHDLIQKICYKKEH